MSMQQHVQLPQRLVQQWRAKRTPRYSQVTEVLRRAFHFAGATPQFLSFRNVTGTIGGIMTERERVTTFRLTDHARDEMARRGIAESEVTKVLAAPEQIETVRAGRKVFQSRMSVGAPLKDYLLRVFVDIDREPPAVVTAYRTSKIEKYWREAE